MPAGDMMSTMRPIAFALLAMSVIACAQGGSGEPGGDGGGGVIDAKPIDAQGPLNNDAPVSAVDAAVDATMIDAFVPPADAPPGSNIFCAAQSDCTLATECCFNFGGASPQGVCVTGTFVPIVNVCVPE